MNLSRDQFAWISTKIERVAVTGFTPKQVRVVDTPEVKQLMKDWAQEQKNGKQTTGVGESRSDTGLQEEDPATPR